MNLFDQLLGPSVKRGTCSLMIPIGDFVNAPPVCLDGERHLNCLAYCRSQLNPVQMEEAVHKDRRCPLILAEPGVILEQSEAEGRGLANKIRSFKSGGVTRSC